MIWLPRQIPNVGISRLKHSRIVSCVSIGIAGSPGPFEKNTPSNFVSSEKGFWFQGTLVTVMSRFRNSRMMFSLHPVSIRAMCLWPRL